jgi:glycosyltransferase involved in cell wall biosynthesis
MSKLKILLITENTDIWDDKSAFSTRMKKYGERLEELHIIAIGGDSKVKDKQLDKNIWIYRASSASSLFSSNDAASIGKKIVFDRKFVRGESVIVALGVSGPAEAGVNIALRWKIPLEVKLDTDPRSLSLLEKRSLGQILKNTNVVSVPTKTMADLIAKEFSFKRGNIFVVPPYVDVKKIEGGTVRFDLHARYGWHFILLSAGALNREKNVPVVIEVLNKLRAFYPDTGLVILGDGPERDKLEAQVKSLGLKASVVFVTDTADASTYYKTSNLYVESAGLESFGEEMIEAGLLGLPVVSTPTGLALDLLNGKEVVLCPYGDVEFMFKAVYDLIGNDQLRESMRHNIKAALESRLLSEEDLLNNLESNWQRTALMIKAS